MIKSTIQVKCDNCRKMLSLSGESLANRFGRVHRLPERMPDLWFETQTDVPILELLGNSASVSSGRFRLRVPVYPGVSQNVDLLGDFCSAECHKSGVRRVREQMEVKKVCDDDLKKMVDMPKKEILQKYFAGESYEAVFGRKAAESAGLTDEAISMPLSDGQGNLVSGVLENATLDQLTQMAEAREWHDRRAQGRRICEPEEIVVEGPKAYSKVVAKVETDGEIGYVRSDILGVTDEQQREFQEEFDEHMSAIEREQPGGQVLPSAVPVHKAGKNIYYEAEETFAEYIAKNPQYPLACDDNKPLTASEITQSAVGEAWGIVNAEREARLEAETQLMGFGITEAVPLEVQHELNKTAEGRKALHRHYEDMDQAIALRNAFTRKSWWRRYFGF